MISLTSAQIEAWIAAFIFPFTRIAAMIATAPILGNKQVPVRVKISLTLAITLLIAPVIEIPAGIQPASARGLLILVEQIVAGVALGFTMRLIFTAIEMAGDIAGMQMGLGFANFYDPQNASYSPVLAQFLGIVTALAFLSIDGHLYMIEVLAASFHSFPIGDSVLPAQSFRMVAEWGGVIFSHALQLALPLIAALLVTNLALGILTRSAPQLNIFAVGFPITLTAGFIALALTLSYLAPLLERLTYEGLNTMARVVKLP